MGGLNIVLVLYFQLKKIMQKYKKKKYTKTAKFNKFMVKEYNYITSHCYSHQT